MRFYAGDVGNTDAHVLRNGVTSLFVSQSTSANPTYAGTLALAAGEMLDFVVGTGSDTCNGDTTPLDVTITKQ